MGSKAPRGRPTGAPDAPAAGAPGSPAAGDELAQARARIQALEQELDEARRDHRDDLRALERRFDTAMRDREELHAGEVARLRGELERLGAERAAAAAPRRRFAAASFRAPVDGVLTAIEAGAELPEGVDLTGFPGSVVEER